MERRYPGFFGQIFKKLSFEGFIRLVTDVVLVNLAILTALAARFFYVVAFESASAIDFRSTFWWYVQAYLFSFWVLTVICVVVFSVSGFYTYGRFYRGRYKALIIFQAVSVAYLIFGALVYFAQIEPVIYLPRGAFVLAWMLTIALLWAARGFNYLWKNVLSREGQRQKRSEPRQVQTVLVIGGAGYIGSALLPRLLEKGYRVVLLDLLLYGTEPIQEFLHHPHLKVLQADFRQVDKVVEAMRDVDAVIHLGALVGDPACALDEDLTVEINVMATRMIAEVAKGSGVERFIFASTCSVYGASQEKLDERSALNPVSLYARSKIASEKVLLKMAGDGPDGFAPVILRFGTIYGLSGRTRFDLVVNLLTAKAVVEKKITIFGGDQWRPFLHVDDAAQALLQVLEAPLPLVRSGIFNVGSNEQNYTIQQVGEIIHRLVPDAELIEAPSGDDPRNYRVDFSKIRNMLGFQPQRRLEDGARQVIQAIDSGKVKDYQDARYSNVKFLTEEGISRLAHHEDGWAYQLLYETGPGMPAVVDM